MWIVPCDPILKLFLVKNVLIGPMNSAQDPQKNAVALKNALDTLSKLYLHVSIFYNLWKARLILDRFLISHSKFNNLLRENLCV